MAIVRRISASVRMLAFSAGRCAARSKNEKKSGPARHAAVQAQTVHQDQARMKSDACNADTPVNWTPKSP